MIKNWLTGINFAITGLAIFFILLGLGLSLMRPSSIPIPEPLPEKTTLPKGAFRLKQEAYDSIGFPFLNLRFSPMTLQLPDMRNYLIYYGRNERPDATLEQSMLHFAISGSNDIASIHPGKPLYLVYDKDQQRVKYRFSPQNIKTSLWLDAGAEGDEALVNVSMINEIGEVIRKPEQYAQFKIKEKQFMRFGQERWELGKWKVDGTLLARQKARWYGKDLFFNRHGGEEYKDYRDKERIDFGQDEESYSVFVGQGTALTWKNDRWVVATPGPESQKYPLLVVANFDDRLMKLVLWDVEGKAKLSINVIRSSESSLPITMNQAFKFLGSRTRSQFMFEVNNERMLISPKDWLVFTDGKWSKLQTPEEIDAYVERKIVGPLFVIDEVVSEEGKQTLVGVLFNATRTEMKPIEIPLQQTSAPSGSTPKTQDARDKPVNRKFGIEKKEEVEGKGGEENVMPEL